jgi:ribosome recycling factor
MNISVKEFRQMIEDHSVELRQSQDDYNEMCDSKEGEIKRLELKLEYAQDALRDMKDKAQELLEGILNGGSVKGASEAIATLYNNLLDGLDGY